MKNETKIYRLEKRIKPRDKYGGVVMLVGTPEGYRLPGEQAPLTGEQLEEIKQSPARIIEIDEDDELL